jgi:hypothetical protein
LWLTIGVEGRTLGVVVGINVEALKHRRAKCVIGGALMQLGIDHLARDSLLCLGLGLGLMFIG